MYKESKAEVKTELLPHQQRIVDRIKANPGLVVAHGLGSGKTLASLAAAADLDQDTLALVPAALQENYNKEIIKHLDGDTKIDVGSIQKAVLQGLQEPTQLLIVDEAHRAREPNTKIHDFIKSYPANKRLLLTASPVYNRPSDVAALVNLAAGTNVLPTGSTFEQKYVKKPSNSLFQAILGKKQEAELINKKELGRILQQWVDYHPSEGADFPDRLDEVVRVPMTKQQTELHDAALNKLPLIARIKLKALLPPDKKDLAALNAFQSQSRQVGGSVSKFTQGGTPEKTPKLQRAVADVLSKLENNPQHKAVVYSNYVDTLKDYGALLDNANVPYRLFTGNEKATDRIQAVRDYNEGVSPVLLVSSAGGEGLDLKNTRQLQVLEPHWNEEKLKQVIGRAIRRKSHDALPQDQRNVLVQRYLTYPKPGIFKRIIGGQSVGIEDILHHKAQDKERLNQQLIALLEKNSMHKTPQQIAETVLTKVALAVPKSLLKKIYLPNLKDPEMLVNHVGTIQDDRGLYARLHDDRVSLRQEKIANPLAELAINPSIARRFFVRALNREIDSQELPDVLAPVKSFKDTAIDNVKGWRQQAQSKVQELGGEVDHWVQEKVGNDGKVSGDGSAEGSEFVGSKGELEQMMRDSNSATKLINRRRRKDREEVAATEKLSHIRKTSTQIAESVLLNLNKINRPHP
jgi:superfamily II DNA or RNA helicase